MDAFLRRYYARRHPLEDLFSRQRADPGARAIGTGLNLLFYPNAVRLTGIDLSEAMLAVAKQRSRELGIDAELLVGDAHALDLPNDRFDTVVSTLFFSSVANSQQAAAEVLRVLKPGGRLVLLDHVRSPIWPVRFVERLLDVPLRRFAGCHLLRAPLEYLGAGGLQCGAVATAAGGA